MRPGLAPAPFAKRALDFVGVGCGEAAAKDWRRLERSAGRGRGGRGRSLGFIIAVESVIDSGVGDRQGLALALVPVVACRGLEVDGGGPGGGGNARWLKEHVN